MAFKKYLTSKKYLCWSQIFKGLLAKSSSEPEKGGCSENSIPKFVSSVDFNGDMKDGKWSEGTTFSGKKRFELKIYYVKIYLRDTPDS